MSEWIVWTIGWFLTAGICGFLDAKTLKMQGRKQMDDTAAAICGFLYTLIYIAGLCFCR